MSTERKTLNATIADKPYKLLCRAEEFDAMTQAAVMLNDTLAEYKKAFTNKTTDQLAVMAALNYAADLIMLTQKNEAAAAAAANQNANPAPLTLSTVTGTVADNAALPSDLQAIEAKLNRLLAN